MLNTKIESWDFGEWQRRALWSPYDESRIMRLSSWDSPVETLHVDQPVAWDIVQRPSVTATCWIGWCHFVEMISTQKLWIKSSDSKRLTHWNVIWRKRFTCKFRFSVCSVVDNFESLKESLYGTISFWISVRNISEYEESSARILLRLPFDVRNESPMMRIPPRLPSELHNSTEFGDSFASSPNFKLNFNLLELPLKSG